MKPIRDYHKRVKALPELIRAGYGVEDIAIKFDCPPELVRRHVSNLREWGVLKTMFPPTQEAAE